MHCKDVSFREVTYPLTLENISRELQNWVAYTRTYYVIFRNGDDFAVVGLRRPIEGGLFRKAIGFDMISTPEETVYHEDPELDVINPSAMAEVQRMFPGRTIVVKGMFSHISFVKDVVPLTLRVIDDVPPYPSKLSVLVKIALGSGFVGLPIVVENEVIDLPAVAEDVRTEAVMFPCKVSNISLSRPVYFLDEFPEVSHEVTLVGCSLSQRIYSSLYGSEVPFINVCPEGHVRDDGVKTLIKCCKVKDGFEVEGNVARVPWGATVPEVVGAINALFDA